jgi:competence protein ComEC
MPFGLDRWPLEVMGFGIDLMMLAAKFVAALPYALVEVPAFPFAALLVMIVGGLWLIIWRGRWRLAGFAGIGAGMALATIHDRPDILIDRDAKIVAIRGADGFLAAPRSRRVQYSLGQWLKADGDGRTPEVAASGRGFRCDSESCVALVKGRMLSFVAKPDALPEDCQRAAILVAPMDIRLPCPAPLVILDRGALWEEGASAIYLSEAGIRLVKASDLRGTRPWSPAHHRRELISPLPPDAPLVPKITDNPSPE